MKKLFTIAAALLTSFSLWAVDINPSFLEGYTTVQVVSADVTSFGKVYFGSRTAVTKNTPNA